MTAVNYGVVLHAGTSDSWYNDESYQQEIEEILYDIAEAAGAKLKSGTKALDVVQMVVTALEDCPHFNAGKGAVLNQNGEHEVFPDHSISFLIY